MTQELVTTEIEAARGHLLMMFPLTRAQRSWFSAFDRALILLAVRMECAQDLGHLLGIATTGAGRTSHTRISEIARQLRSNGLSVQVAGLLDDRVRYHSLTHAGRQAALDVVRRVSRHLEGSRINREFERTSHAANEVAERMAKAFNDGDVETIRLLAPAASATSVSTIAEEVFGDRRKARRMGCSQRAVLVHEVWSAALAHDPALRMSYVATLLYGLGYLSTARQRVLVAALSTDPTSQADLARLAACAPSTVSSTVDQLVADGLATKSSRARSVQVALSAAGLDLVTQNLEQVGEVLAWLNQGDLLELRSAVLPTRSVPAPPAYLHQLALDLLGRRRQHRETAYYAAGELVDEDARLVEMGELQLDGMSWSADEAERVRERERTDPARVAARRRALEGLRGEGVR